MTSKWAEKYDQVFKSLILFNQTSFLMLLQVWQVHHNRTYGDKWIRFFTERMPFLLPKHKAMNKTEVTKYPNK